MGIMELEILKLIYDYSVREKIADRNFIDKLIDIVVTRRSLDGYVKNVAFTNTLEKSEQAVTIAGYRPLCMDILIDYESIQTMLVYKEKFECLFHSQERMFFRNLEITQTILHELEHAYQNKLADDNKDNSIEKKLIKACHYLIQAMKNPNFTIGFDNDTNMAHDLNIYFHIDRELYKKYYMFNPTERLAQYGSFTTILNLIEQIKEKIPNLFLFENASLVDEMLHGYTQAIDLGICPTQVYLSKIRRDHVWTSFDFYDQNPNQLINNVRSKYTLKKRLSLGLPVTADEYYQTLNWLQSTNKYNI